MLRPEQRVTDYSAKCETPAPLGVCINLPNSNTCAIGVCCTSTVELSEFKYLQQSVYKLSGGIHFVKPP